MKKSEVTRTSVMYVSLSSVVKLYQAILYGLNVAGYSRDMSKKAKEHIFQKFASKSHLVGGFNPSEKYKSNWKSSPNKG